MKNSRAKATMSLSSLMLLLTVVCTLAALPSPSRAKAQPTITVTNNSSREIDHLYTSPTDRKDWSADQLPEDSKLQTGESFTLTNVITENDQIKVIAEDKDGCFLYAVVSCQEAATWIINNNTTRDCGN